MRLDDSGYLLIAPLASQLDTWGQVAGRMGGAPTQRLWSHRELGRQGGARRMPKMTGGQALIKSLYREGVRVVFGMPGVQIYGAMDALYDEPGIRFITVRHEQAAAYMAYGYSRAGTEIGTALVVPGPGLQNASAGIGTAYAASTPILVVAGQLPKDEIGVERGGLHELHEQLDVVRPVTKWAARVPDVADVPEAVHEAFSQMRSGRPRPTEVEIPLDTLSEVAEVELLEPAIHVPAQPSEDAVREAAGLIQASSRPIIVAGGGVILSHASDALTELAELLQAPVVATSEGRGAISDHHHLSLGGYIFDHDWSDEIVIDSDLILAVGSRLVRSRFGRQRIVQIDVDSDEIGRNHPNTVGVVGDARLALIELTRALSPSGQRNSAERLAEIAEARRTRLDQETRPEPQRSFVNAIRAAMPDDGIVVEGITQIGYATRSFYPVYVPGTYVTSSYYGNLGYVYPTALGAKVAQPDKAVVAISGDGGFLYNSQELATAVKYGINAVVIVFNDNAYGNVLRDQKLDYNGRTIGADLHNPDFVKLAEAYGARGLRARDASELEATLREALSVEAPALIEVPVGMMPRLW